MSTKHQEIEKLLKSVPEDISLYELNVAYCCEIVRRKLNNRTHAMVTLKLGHNVLRDYLRDAKNLGYWVAPSEPGRNWG